MLNLKVDADVIGFVDDTAIIPKDMSSKLYYKTNIILNGILLWFDNNFLKLNLNKTKYMVFSLNNFTPLILLGHTKFCSVLLLLLIIIIVLLLKSSISKISLSSY